VKELLSHQPLYFLKHFIFTPLYLWYSLPSLVEMGQLPQFLPLLILGILVAKKQTLLDSLG
jgi:hypothetical protein